MSPGTNTTNTNTIKEQRTAMPQPAFACASQHLDTLRIRKHNEMHLNSHYRPGPGWHGTGANAALLISYHRMLMYSHPGLANQMLKSKKEMSKPTKRKFG